MTTEYKIGSFTYSPEEGRLISSDVDQTLEYRAAQSLNMLLERQGGIVSHDDFVTKIWDGRTVSANSVAVVIGDLRRALGDNAKQPIYIETVPKRGYRWIGEASVHTSPPEVIPEIGKRGLGSFLPLALLLPALLFVGLFAFGGLSSPAHEKTRIAVDMFVNDTQNQAHDPLSISITELVSTELSRHERIAISTDDRTNVRISGKLIMWSGHVATSLHAEDVASGERIWSGMASGPEDLLPSQIKAEIREFSDMLNAESAPGENQ